MGHQNLPWSWISRRNPSSTYSGPCPDESARWRKGVHRARHRAVRLYASPEYARRCPSLPTEPGFLAHSEEGWPSWESRFWANEWSISDRPARGWFSPKQLIYF